MRRTARTDGNHANIVKVFRMAGCSVTQTYQLGGGVPDIVVGFPNDISVWVEIKDGSLPPSARKLTEPEEEFHGKTHGLKAIIESTEDAIALITQIRNVSIQPNNTRAI